MRRLGILFVVAAAGMACGRLVNGQQPTARLEPEVVRTARFARIEADEIRVGDVRIIKTSDGSGASGIWVHTTNGRSAVIYADPKQGPVLGIYSRTPGTAGERRDDYAMDFAVAPDAGGKPMIQVRGRDGKLKWIDVAKIQAND